MIARQDFHRATDYKLASTLNLHVVSRGYYARSFKLLSRFKLLSEIKLLTSILKELKNIYMHQLKIENALRCWYY